MKSRLKASGRVRLASRLFGWRPHPTQKLWLLDESRVKVAACGRRWGKTEAAAVDAATFAVAAPGSVQMIVSPTYDQSRLIFDTVERLVLGQRVTLRMSKVTRTPYPRIRIGRSLVMARTADEDGRNLRGHSADRVIVDEAAYVKDAVVQEVIGPMLADTDGQLVMISTPFGKNHFYHAFLQGAGGQGSGASPGGQERSAPVESEADNAGGTVGKRLAAGACRPPTPCPQPPTRYASFRFPSWENPFISRDYIEFQRGVLTPRQFAVEYEAEFLDDQSSVFGWGLIENAVALSRSVAEAEEPWVVAGVDWARYTDYTAVVVLDVGAVPHRVVAMDRFHRLTWEAQVERVTGMLLRHRVSAVLTDQTSVGDPLLEQLRKRIWDYGAGMSVEGLTFTNASKREIIDNLVIRLAHQELAIPDDEQLVRELQYFEYELTVAGNVRTGARAGYTDDLVIALALAEAKARSHGGPARFLSSGRRRAAGGEP
jgi:phage FluMu gp28-like protein